MKFVKNAIKKWLDIKEAPKPISVIEMRSMIGEAVEELLKDPPEESRFYYSEERINDSRRYLQMYINNGVKDVTTKTATAITTELIAGESFIDSIVFRIKNKQLGTH